MIISELIAALEKAKAKHGDIEVGYFSNPGAHSFSAIESLSLAETNAYSSDWPEKIGKPRLPERWVIDLYNGNIG